MMTIDEARPQANGSTVTTPRAALMMSLLGSGLTAGPITITRDELTAIRRLYGFMTEPANTKPEPPAAPQRASFDAEWKYRDALRAHEVALKRHANWQDPKILYQAGADRNAIRHAEADGLRLLAWLARYVVPGQDPLKCLIQMATDAGFDVDPEDVSWAE